MNYWSLKNTLLFQNLQIIQGTKTNLLLLVYGREVKRYQVSKIFLLTRLRNQMRVQDGGEKRLPISFLAVFLFTQDYYGNTST